MHFILVYPVAKVKVFFLVLFAMQQLSSFHHWASYSLIPPRPFSLSTPLSCIRALSNRSRRKVWVWIKDFQNASLLTDVFCSCYWNINGASCIVKLFTHSNLSSTFPLLETPVWFSRLISFYVTIFILFKGKRRKQYVWERITSFAFGSNIQ